MMHDNSRAGPVIVVEMMLDNSRAGPELIMDE